MPEDPQAIGDRSCAFGFSALIVEPFGERHATNSDGRRLTLFCIYCQNRLRTPSEHITTMISDSTPPIHTFGNSRRSVMRRRTIEFRDSAFYVPARIRPEDVTNHRLSFLHAGVFLIAVGSERALHRNFFGERSGCLCRKLERGYNPYCRPAGFDHGRDFLNSAQFSPALAMKFSIVTDPIARMPRLAWKGNP